MATENLFQIHRWLCGFIYCINNRLGPFKRHWIRHHRIYYDLLTKKIYDAILEFDKSVRVRDITVIECSSLLINLNFFILRRTDVCKDVQAYLKTYRLVSVQFNCFCHFNLMFDYGFYLLFYRFTIENLLLPRTIPVTTINELAASDIVHLVFGLVVVPCIAFLAICCLNALLLQLSFSFRFYTQQLFIAPMNINYYDFC